MITSFELEKLLIAHLVREKGGNSQTWQRALRKVIVHDATTHAHCNWDVRPGGTEVQRAVLLASRLDTFGT